MVLAASGLGVALAGRRVLEGADLELFPGEVVGLLGPNGAGKSTLLRALAGQIVFEGSVTLAGRSVRDYQPAARARVLAYLPQQRVIGWPLSVRDAVGIGRMPWRGFGRAPDERDARICAEAMAVMDVDALAARRVTELSGGEQARVIAARAIAQDTPVLLADEPASGLDPAHQIGMMAALRLLAGRGRAILVSLHDLTLAARWCDRVLVLDRGRIAAAGTPETVMNSALLRDAFGITALIGRQDGGLVVAPTGLAENGPAATA